MTFLWPASECGGQGFAVIPECASSVGVDVREYDNVAW